MRGHVEAFNAAVRSGEWQAFAARFADDAAMRFVGVPAGPYAGRAAIQAAYEERPPTDTLVVEGVEQPAPHVDVVLVSWSSGGTGSMTLAWSGDLVGELVVRFDATA